MNRTDTNDAIIEEIVIKAPAEQVFEAIADPRQRVKWWGAEGRFQATHMESDLRLGGAWVMGGTGPQGKPFTIRGEYCAIECPRLLEFTWLADFEESASLSVLRFDLEEQDGATTVRLTHSGFASVRARETYQGWPWLLSLLQAYVESKVAGGAA